MHLNEVEVLLEYFGFFSSLVNNIDFITENDNWDTKIHFQDALTQRHIQSHVNFWLIIINIIITSRLKFFRMLYNQVSLVIKLRFFVGLNMPHNFLLHLFMYTMGQVGSHSKDTFAQS